jgi:predicted RNA binding protein YcfA (HicA-like mRNA interferase family)
MSALPKTISQKTGRTLLEGQGWTKTRGGKHNVKMEKEGERPITLPKHRGTGVQCGSDPRILKQAVLL